MAAPRMPKLRILTLGAPALLIVLVIGWLVGSLFNLAGPILWIVRGLFWVLGFFAIYLLLRLVQRRDSAGSSEPDAIDGLLTQARKRLASAGVTGRGALSKLPVVLILGPSGSAKTTLVVQSGLEAEHLAGNVHMGEGMAPTEALNLWYHENHVLIEAAGPIAVEPARFARLVRRTLPSKWIPTLLGKPQAPRVAVVCVSCEDLVGRTASDGAIAVARNLRARLAELSSALGIRLPIYVVFTKVDLVPHFTEYVQGFTDDEVRDVLGATLKAVEAPEATSHAERESKRLGAAFDELFHSLASRRLSVLSRGAADVSDRAYEFPREFRKLSVPAIQFLVELTKPSQLRVSPFLRGFYFTGVRPVVVPAEAAGPMLPPEAIAPAAAAGATQVFNLQDLEAARQLAATPRAGHERRIPQWVFMERILAKAVLKDRLAIGMTAAGVGLMVRRRLVMAGLLGLTTLLGVFALVGYRSDRRLVDEIEAAIEGVQSILSAEPSLPPLEDLERLARLGRVTETLSSFENHGRPARRWLAMYTGHRLYPLARSAYFVRFRTLLLNRAHVNVVRTLDDTPNEPTLDEYVRVYQALKAYVEMTAIPDSARADFFGTVLTSHWALNEAPDSALMALARNQFELYGHELPHGNPYSDPSDDRRINTARTFLADNTTADSFYANLLAQWDRLPWVRFNQDFEGTDAYVRNPLEVRGAFTKLGWDSVRVSLNNIGEGFNLDAHVVGSDFFRSLQALDMGPELLSRYEREYRDTWVAFLEGATISFPGLPGSGDWLGVLAGNRSALLQMLTVVAQHTRAPALGNVFAPVHVLTDSVAGERLFSDAAGLPYLDKLGAMGRAMATLAEDPGSPDAAAGARTVALDGQGFVDGLARDFPTSPAAAGAASDAVAALLRSPFERASVSTGSGTQIAGNSILSRFCPQVEAVLQRYPFRTDGPPASLEDVTALFHPDDGVLQSFFTELEETYPNPGRSYVAFRGKARAIARTLFENDAPEPRMSLSIRVPRFEGISGVTLNVDGQTAQFSPTRAGRQSVEWDAPRAEAVKLTVQVGERTDSLTFGGTWAIFRLFHRGAWEDESSGSYSVSWSFAETGATVVADVQLRGEPILDRGYFDGFICPSTVTR